MNKFLFIAVIAVFGALAPVSRSIAANGNVEPIGNYVNIVAIGSGMTKGFFIQLWSYKDSLIGVLEYQDDNHDWGGASEARLKEVLYDSTTGNLSFKATLLKPCARKKPAPCTPSQVTVRFKGVLEKYWKDVMTGTMEMHGISSEGKSISDEVVIQDPVGGWLRVKDTGGKESHYTHYESYQKWLAAMNELVHQRGRGVLE